MLRLEGETVTLPVGTPARTKKSPVEEIARVELQAGLGREDLECATAPGVECPSRQHERGRARLVEDEVVVVTLASTKLLVVRRAESRAARMFLPMGVGL